MMASLKRLRSYSAAIPKRTRAVLSASLGHMLVALH
jgi:hypothetical protein